MAKYISGVDISVFNSMTGKYILEFFFDGRYHHWGYAPTIAIAKKEGYLQQEDWKKDGYEVHEFRIIENPRHENSR